MKKFISNVIYLIYFFIVIVLVIIVNIISGTYKGIRDYFKSIFGKKFELNKDDFQDDF